MAGKSLVIVESPTKARTIARFLGGEYIVKASNGHIRDLSRSIAMAFLPNYSMHTALLLVAGCDVWLNTPQPPFEASGTSGMKAALNGVPNFSVLDGWWAEGHLEGVTGWAIGDAAQATNGATEDAYALGQRLLGAHCRVLIIRGHDHGSGQTGGHLFGKGRPRQVYSPLGHRVW